MMSKKKLGKTGSEGDADTQLKFVGDEGFPERFTNQAVLLYRAFTDNCPVGICGLSSPKTGADVRHEGLTVERVTTRERRWLTDQIVREAG